MEGQSNTAKNLGQDSRCSGVDLHQEHPEFEAGVVTTRP
jgi:hypothetical protein